MFPFDGFDASTRRDDVTFVVTSTDEVVKYSADEGSRVHLSRGSSEKQAWLPEMVVKMASKASQVRTLTCWFERTCVHGFMCTCSAARITVRSIIA